VTSSECRGADGVSGSERACEAQQEENAMAVFVVCFERKKASDHSVLNADLEYGSIDLTPDGNVIGFKPVRLCSRYSTSLALV
jgi:hypothetical protein